MFGVFLFPGRPDFGIGYRSFLPIRSDRSRMYRGIALAFAAYALFACADAVIKSFGPGTNVFEVAFFITFFSAIPLILARPVDERWLEFWRMRHPFAVVGRALCGIFGGMCGIYAFTHLPLAEAYALIFLMPLFVTVMSVLFLAEPVGWRRTMAVVGGFVGVLIVVRPGFREVELAHFGAAAVAFFGAVGMIVLRRIANKERRVSLIGVTYIVSLLVNGVLMLPGFEAPESGRFLGYFFAGCFAGGGQICLLFAAKNAPANLIAPAQYSQIAWAITMGALFFDEFPDMWTMTGLAFVAFAGLFTFMREEMLFGWARRVPILRDRI